MTSFAEASAITQVSSHEYSANLLHDWCIASVPHGGIVASCFMRVAALHFSTTLAKQNQPHAVTMHLEYVRRTSTGPATFKVRDVKLGGKTSTVHIALFQDQREEVVGYLTHSNITNESGPSFETSWKLDPRPVPVDLKALSAGTETRWLKQKEMPYPKIRMAVDRYQFYFPADGQPSLSMIDQWVRLSSGENFTNVTLGSVSDCFPQMIENLSSGTDLYSVKPGAPAAKRGKEANFWYPTLLLNLDVKKALPEEGVEWLFVRVQAKQIKNGRNDLEVVIMDAEGDLVALSHHVVYVLPMARNRAKRSAGGKL